MSPGPPASSHLCSTQILWGSVSFYCVTSIGGGGAQLPHRSWKHQVFFSLLVQQGVDMLLALFSGRWCLRLGGLCCDVDHVTPASCPFAAAPQVTLGACPSPNPMAQLPRDLGICRSLRTRPGCWGSQTQLLFLVLKACDTRTVCCVE